MKKLLSLLLFFFPFLLTAQDTTTHYKNLGRKNFYMARAEQKGKTYTANGKKVSKEIYERDTASWTNMTNCKPCILTEYDEHDKLFREGIMYTDCPAGWFREYYTNGRVKVSGQYRENPTNNWDSAYYLGNCAVPNGQWVYYWSTGDTAYCEFWNNGTFVRQVPEQKTCEIWKIVLTLNGDTITDKTTIKTSDFPKLVITPYFKNNNTTINLLYKLQISAVGYPAIDTTYAPQDWNTVNIQKLMEAHHMPPSANPHFDLTIMDGEHPVSNFFLQVEF